MCVIITIYYHCEYFGMYVYITILNIEHSPRFGGRQPLQLIQQQQVNGLRGALPHPQGR